MVLKWLKVAKKENNKDEILGTIDQILSGDFSGLDIIKVKGKRSYYRCRVGKIRILFF